MQLCRDGEPLPDDRLRDATTRSLLKYLVIQQGRLIPKEVLMERCWPNSGIEAGRASLHAAISRIRQALSDRAGQVLRRLGPGYMLILSADYEVDQQMYLRLTTEAEQRAANGDWVGVRQVTQAAEGLVAGELLACEPYADWAEEAREAFRRQRAALLDLSLTALGKTGAWLDLVAAARLAIRLDPLREGPYRALMQAYAALGEMALALRTYEECRSSLSEALGLEPTEATRSTYAMLLNSQSLSASREDPP